MTVNKKSMEILNEYLPLVEKIQKKGTYCEEMKVLEQNFHETVLSIAREYEGQGKDIDDLVNAGNVGLEIAAMKYSLQADFSFSSYSVWWIRQQMIQIIHE